ncbi:hypothetical protein Hanom_Chr02g00155411 [Helianthus anomalus]
MDYPYCYQFNLNRSVLKDVRTEILGLFLSADSFIHVNGMLFLLMKLEMAQEKRDQGRRRPMSFRWTTGDLSNKRSGNEVMSHL